MSTQKIMTKYEKVKIIGLRAEQLQRGAQPLVEFKEFDARKIAAEELKQGKLPFMICRKMPDGKLEYIKLEDMIIL